MSTVPTVLITGACGNLGKATAQLLRAGWRLALADRSHERLRNLFPDAVEAPDLLLLDGVDLGDGGAVGGMIGRVLDRFGRIDALVHTVGAFRGGLPVEVAPLEDWEFLFAANVRTALHCCRAVLPVMKRQQAGRIITVAARTGWVGEAGYAAYSAAKSAVIRLTESLSDEVKAHGITANCLLPGTLDTPENRRAQPDADVSRWLPPVQVAEVIRFLISPAAGAVNGAAIPLGGKG